jgi:phosphopantetheinyl transferase (holo-ACP synthase)
MTKIITFQNVEKLVFMDSELKKLLPNFKTIFYNWAIAQKESSLKPMAQKMLIDFVNKVSKEDISVLSDYFHEEVKVEKIDANVVNHMEISIYDAENYLNSQTILKEALLAYREGEQLYLSVWR